MTCVQGLRTTGRNTAGSISLGVYLSVVLRSCISSDARANPCRLFSAERPRTGSRCLHRGAVRNLVLASAGVGHGLGRAERTAPSSLTSDGADRCITCTQVAMIQVGEGNGANWAELPADLLQRIGTQLGLGAIGSGRLACVNWASGLVTGMTTLRPLCSGNSRCSPLCFPERH